MFLRLTNRESNLNDDKSQFDPERRAQNAVLTILDSEALILGANEDGSNDVANTSRKSQASNRYMLVTC